MKKIKFILLILFMIFIVGCSFGHIEDTNGEDNYTLAVLNEESFFTYKSSTMMGNVTSQIGKKYTQKVSKFSGVSKIMELDDNYTYSIEFCVTSGNGLVGIICDDEVINTINPNSSFTVSVPSGKDYQVLVLGESCEFKIVINEN